MWKLIFTLGVVGALLAPAASAATNDEDVARYIAIFQGPSGGEVHLEAVRDLAWMGMSDPRLFDLLEAKVRAELGVEDKLVHERVAHYIRALGYSGQQKYEPFLRELTLSKVKPYARHSQTALRDLADYSRWNPVISDRSRWRADQTDEMNRIRVMLEADDLGLVRIGAKRVYFGRYDEAVLNSLMAQVTKRYPKTFDVRDPEQIDATAWLVKALGSLRATGAQPLLEQISSDTEVNGKVRKYAMEGVKKYKKHGPAS